MTTPKAKWFEDLRYVDFKLIEEPWNTYKLADGSILNVKLVLTNVIVDGDLGEIVEKAKVTKRKMKLRLAFDTRPLASVKIPKNLRGPPSPPSKPKESTPLLAQEDIDFAVVSEKWNRYELEHGVGLKIKNTLVRVDRTIEYDEQGIPQYQFNGSTIVRVIPPK